MLVQQLNNESQLVRPSFLYQKERNQSIFSNGKFKTFPERNQLTICEN